MTLKLQQALETLYGAERRRDALGLDGTRALLAALGNPERRFRSVHVAGTNGKGSVATLIERALRAASIRTGLFTSPHLVEFRERIRVRGRWADDARLEGRLEHLRGLPEAEGRTFFEVATALGFDHFAAAGVSLGVIEVGLGGRLDCTNVILPEVAVITSVGLDHEEVLGTGLEAIAAEKAGIVKRGVPVVSAVNEPAPAGVIEQAAVRVGAPLIHASGRVRLVACETHAHGLRLEAEVAPWGRLDLEVGLRGRHQAANAVTALAALSALAERGVAIPAVAVRSGFSEARWPGRLEPCPREPRLWWDGAHNADGARALASAWRHDLGLDSPGAIVFAVARDKDAAAMLHALRGLAPRGRLFLTRTRNGRAASLESLCRIASEAGWAADASDDVATALGRALGAAGEDRVLLCGSLFAVGEAMERMGGAPGECP